MSVTLEISPLEQKLLNILPRIAASISFCCASHMTYTILKSRYYRSRIYHRLILGCSIYIIILNMVTFWGSAAAPAGTSHISGAKGTIATCSAEGFLYQVAVFIVPLYYAALSCLSYLHVTNKFKIERFMWIEKWLHLGVHSYPLGSAIYFLSIDAYNPIITSCWVASVPLGCGGGSGEICTRGPDNIGDLHLYMLGLPNILIALGPTIIIMSLYIKVRRQNARISSSIAKQGLTLLLMLYWTYLFRWIDAAMIFGGGEHSHVITLIANINGALIGVWVSIIYRIFRSDDPLMHSAHSNNITEQPSKQQNKGDCEGKAIDTTKAKPGPVVKMCKPEFSIFDGNNIPDDSPWQSYLSEGIDLEYEEEEDCVQF
mmetsp:Transcript_2991/g.4513  ORF Transcript_2991/g.4513 Transcript_2991/m.4513 type:complete len:372 (+) Transcript_2991:129-1244(+)